MKQTLAILLAAGLGTAGLILTADEYGPYQDAGGQDTIEFRGGVIRFPSGTVGVDGVPYVHANSGHVAVGIVDTYVEPDGDLVIVTDGTSPVMSAWVSADETLSSRGIFCGASVGSTQTVVRCYKDGVGRLYLDEQADWDLMSSPLANLWVGWAKVTDRP